MSQPETAASRTGRATAAAAAERRVCSIDKSPGAEIRSRGFGGSRFGSSVERESANSRTANPRLLVIAAGVFCMISPMSDRKYRQRGYQDEPREPRREQA